PDSTASVPSRVQALQRNCSRKWRGSGTRRLRENIFQEPSRDQGADRCGSSLEDTCAYSYHGVGRFESDYHAGSDTPKRNAFFLIETTRRHKRSHAGPNTAKVVIGDRRKTLRRRATRSGEDGYG